MPTNLFIAGFVGALAPEIVRLYTLKQSNVSFPNWYFVISGVYALLGGYVATIAPGVTSPWWAFAVGAGLPTVVNAAIRAVGIIMGQAVAPAAKGGGAASRRAVPAPSRTALAARGTFWDFVRAL